jgi:hypothetical protein
MVYGTYTDIDENCRCERNFNVSGGSQATQDAIQDFKAFDTLDKMNLDTKEC